MSDALSAEQLAEIDTLLASGWDGPMQEWYSALIDMRTAYDAILREKQAARGSTWKTTKGHTCDHCQQGLMQHYQQIHCPNSIIAITAQRDALQQRLAEVEEKHKHRFGACQVCWTDSWQPCSDGKEGAVKMTCSNGVFYFRCLCCWQKAQLAAAQARIKEQECLEALCGHDHSTQWWEVRTHKAQVRLAVAEARVTALRTALEHAQDYLIGVHLPDNDGGALSREINAALSTASGQGQALDGREGE